MRTLTPSAFGNDDGLADPAVRRALGAAVATPDARTYLSAVAELCAARLLVAVVARPVGGVSVGASPDTTGGAVASAQPGGDRQPGGDKEPQGDKESEMSVVLLRTAEGRLGMLAFTGTDALRAWDPAARPVPTTLDVAAASARHDGADTLVVDLQGPHPLVIEGEVLDQLAAGHRLMALPDGEFGWAVPAPHEGADAGQGDRSGPAV